VFGSSLGRLTSLDAESGEVRWRRETDNADALAQPAVTPRTCSSSPTAALLFDRATGGNSSNTMPSPSTTIEAAEIHRRSDRIVAFGFDQRRPWWSSGARHGDSCDSGWHRAATAASALGVQPTERGRWRRRSPRADHGERPARRVRSTSERRGAVGAKVGPLRR
jgi:hypothetical protein